ncbi:MAG: DUF3021 domain-containing protein [Erysipelotrichaceae bacterium]|jgi:hypothetical protein|nr:DUF3021 domain-containing protein [Erysipelotrichaceae bacterium]
METQKSIYKKIFELIFFGITWGSFWMVLTAIIIDNTTPGGLISLSSDFNFTKNALLSMLIGVGWSLPTLIYDVDRLPMLVKSLLHFAIGSTVFFIVAFYLGWIPVDFRWTAILQFVVVYLLIFLAIWFLFYLYYRGQRDKINRKLREINQE